MTERTLPIADSKQVAKAVWTALRPDRRSLILGLVLSVVATSFATAATRLLGIVIDNAADGHTHTINVIGLVLLASILVTGITGLAARRVLARVAERALGRMRHDTFDAAMRLRLDTVERVGTADPLSRLTGDIANVSDAAHDIAPLLITLSLSSGLALIALVLTSPLLALAAAVGLPIVAVMIPRYLRNIGPMNQRWLVNATEVNRTIHEIADGGRTLRAFGAEDRWTQRLRNNIEREWDSEWPQATERNRLFPAANIAQACSLSAIFIVGMLAYSRGSMSLGVVSASALYVVQAFVPVNGLFDLLDKVQMATASLARVVGVTLADRDETPTAETSTEVEALRTPSDGTVVLDDVHFAYFADGHEVLHGVNLRIESGERIAVVGVSGAGKSTIAKLVVGIHEPTSGTVSVGGVPVGDLDDNGNRRWVALVTQESHIFLGSVADNCRLAQPDATDEELERVLRAVHAWDWVTALPDGIDTRIGSDGLPLTLVQEQQVALARVLLIDPYVVILDEATAGLGSSTARGIEKAFAAVLDGRTVITIAHRLDVAASADRVIVVDHGRIETGTHDELSSGDGAYALMWRHWTALRT